MWFGKLQTRKFVAKNLNFGGAVVTAGTSTEEGVRIEADFDCASAASISLTVPQIDIS
jgi:hypothetical protein